MPIRNRLTKMLNAFLLQDTNQSFPQTYSMGPSTSVRPHIPRPRYANEKSIISSIYTRIAIDFAGLDIRHVVLDEKSRYKADVASPLNLCFTLQPNLDQAPRSFRQDIALTVLEEGVAAIVPVDYTIDEAGNQLIDIETLRVGSIKEWFPKHVRVSLYNEEKAERQEIILEKKHIAIVENPFYSVMNEPNSTLQRLLRKLNLLDVIDEQSSSGKLDIIIQLPYTIRSDAKRQQAEKRRDDIEFQLKDSRYGIAYAEATEKITQLNRPAENNMLKQVEFLSDMLYSQLGITKTIMDGTADEKTMLNYINRTIEPLLDATIEAMQRTFLGIKGTEKQERIRYFRNPFKLVPLSEVANISDKFARNEILSSNEIRNYMGIPPADDPKADQLVNSNMPQSNTSALAMADMDSVMNEVFDGLTSDIKNISKGVSDGG